MYTLCTCTYCGPQQPTQGYAGTEYRMFSRPPSLLHKKYLMETVETITAGPETRQKSTSRTFPVQCSSLLGDHGTASSRACKMSIHVELGTSLLTRIIVFSRFMFFPLRSHLLIELSSSLLTTILKGLQGTSAFMINISTVPTAATRYLHGSTVLWGFALNSIRKSSPPPSRSA